MTGDTGLKERAGGIDAGAALLPQAAVAVDVAVLSVEDGALQLFVIRREAAPEAGKWALPGGFVEAGESLDQAAVRVLREKSGLEGVYLEQLYTFGDPARDPRTRVITVAYYALVDPIRLRAGGRGANIAWLDVPWEGETGGPVTARGKDGKHVPLAFDHAEIAGMAVKRIRGKLNYTPIGFQLLRPEFTLRQLQQVHEAVLGRKINKDSFRRRMLMSGELEATGRQEIAVDHRPAELYRFVHGHAV